MNNNMKMHEQDKVPLDDDDDDIDEHQQHKQQSHNLVKHKFCLICSNKINRIIQIHKNNTITDETQQQHYNNYQHQKQQPQNNAIKRQQQQLVSINVTDTENNLNVCMCALLYASNDNLINDQEVNVINVVKENNETNNGEICSRCRNIIKQQPIEHRRTLISKRLLIANDIIVNRIDTHYLNTYTNNKVLNDPYTPESIESHSPLPELERFENDSHSLFCGGGDGDNNQTGGGGFETIKLGGVSPRQLKSRLESLRNSGTNLTNSCESLNGGVVSGVDGVVEKKKQSKWKKLCPKFCVIL